jgi:hypothetical protein
MSSFLDEYGIKAEDIKEAGFKLPPVGVHNFEIGDAKVQKGTKNKPGETAFIIVYQLSDADGESVGSTDERRVIKQDGKVTAKAQSELGWLDRRLKDLGFLGGLRDPEFTGPDSVVGIKGTLEIKHNTSGDRKFANVYNVDVDSTRDAEADANEFAEDVPEDIAAPTKRQSRAKKPAAEPAENPAAANEDLWSED